jgi:hypothetical protein
VAVLGFGVGWTGNGNGKGKGNGNGKWNHGGAGLWTERSETEKLGQKTKVRKPKLENGNRSGKVRSQKTGIESGKSEVRKRKLKVRKPDLELENENPDFHFNHPLRSL